MATTHETVVITDYDYGDVDIERRIVEQAGFELVGAQCKTEDEVIEVARDAAAIVAQYATISARVIAQLSECRVIARYGTGVDIVDVDAATEHEILVTNVPNEWCENEVADHAMALLLAASRKLNVYDRATRASTWQWQSGAPIHRLRGSMLGLLSFGAIARAIAARAAGFGMRIIAHDPYLPAEELAAAGAEAVSFDELVTESDCLVIQAPLTAQTRHLFDEVQLRRMKPTAILINTARGPIVDDRALHRALSEGWIAGAGLDDIEEEPSKVRDWRPDNPLFDLDNVIITPHAAYYSEEAIDTVRHFAAEEVVRVLTGKAPLSPVNAGELAEARRSRSRQYSDADTPAVRTPDSTGGEMSDLIAVAYPDKETAETVRSRLMQLTTEHVIELEDAVVVDRDENGKIKLHQLHSPAAAGAAGGALWGGLIGLIFLAPLLGAAIGAAAGGAAGAFTDVGISNRFMQDLGEKLTPGGAALIVLVRRVTPDKVLPEVAGYGGDVIQTSLDDEAEERLRELLETRSVGAAA